MSSSNDQARKAFVKRGGTLSTSEALAAGVHPRTLYALRDAGELEPLSRGIYRLTDLPPLREPDLATVAKRVPQGVICLISALALHQLTTQIPHMVHLALPRFARTPKLEYPPLQVYRFSEQSFAAGIETRSMDGINVRIYSPEKTLADCFKFRNKIGLDVTLEALKAYGKRKRPDFQRVFEFARVCRVEKIIRPYLDTSI